jgi:hypothetical protein
MAFGGLWELVQGSLESRGLIGDKHTLADVSLCDFDAQYKQHKKLHYPGIMELALKPRRSSIS